MGDADHAIEDREQTGRVPDLATLVPLRLNGRAGPVLMARPAPLTPGDCDLTDFQFMPLLVGRLRDSELASEQTPEENWAAVLLWAASWHQVPAASLPDVDTTIAKWAGYQMRGKVDPRWKEVRKGAMRGFVLCSDGRWYHPVVAQVAREAWLGKLKQRLKTECSRIKKHNERNGTSLPFPDFDSWLSQGCPTGQPLFVPSDKPPLSPGQAPPVTGETLSKGQGEGQGQGQGQGFNTSEASPLHPTTAEPPIGPPAEQGSPPGIPPPPPLPDCPHQLLVGLYAKHLPQLRQPAKWGGARAEAMRKRWRECSQPSTFSRGYATTEAGLAFWEKFFRYVASTDLARGFPRPSGKTWTPDLTWLVNAENFLKVIEGKYTE